MSTRRSIGRKSRRFAIAALVAVGSLWQASSARAQTKREPPVVLPKVDVYANVPLVKVAEYQMREARYQPAAVALGDFIYIIGGSTAHDSLLDSVERFNVRTGKSEDFAKLGNGRSGHRAVVVGNRIYVLGGYSTLSYQSVTGGGGVASGSVWADNPYDVMATRSENPNIPTGPGVIDPTQVSDGHGLRTVVQHVSGVAEVTGLEQSVEILDLATRKVTHAAEMPDPRALFGCVARDGKIFVVGGRRLYRHSSLSRTNTVEVFDLATGKWSAGVPMPTPRETEAVLVDGRVIVVPGGYDGKAASSAVEVFDPQARLWRFLPPLCRPTSAHSLVFLGDYLFLFGHDALPGELVAYDLKAKTSEAFTLQYRPARNTAAVVHEDKIYVIGGQASSVSDPLNTIQVFALRKKT